MTNSEIISVIALVVSVISMSVSAWVAFRDRARLTATSTFIGPLQRKTENLPFSRQPAQIFIKIANKGRRPVALRGFTFSYTNKAMRGEPITQGEKNGLTLNENEVHTLTVQAADCFMNKQLLQNIYFEDTLDRKYKIEGVKDSIRRLIEAEGYTPKQEDAASA